MSYHRLKILNVDLKLKIKKNIYLFTSILVFTYCLNILLLIDIKVINYLN